MSMKKLNMKLMAVALQNSGYTLCDERGKLYAQGSFKTIKIGKAVIGFDANEFFCDHLSLSTELKSFEPIPASASSI